MPIRLASRRQQSGLSLIEVLIATVVLSTGLLGLAGLQIAGMKTTHNSYQMQQATWIVHDLLERMRANRTEVFREDNSVPDSKYLLAIPLAAATTDLKCNDPASLVTAALYCDGAVPKNCSVDMDCTGQQMAAYDIYNVMCGDGTDNGINNVLMGGRLRVICPTNDCGETVQVKLEWDERNATSQKDFTGDIDGIETFNICLNSSL